MRGIVTIALLTWLEARRRRIVLAAILGGLVFVAAFATAAWFARSEIAGAGVVQSRVLLLVMFVMALYVVNFLTIAVAIMLPVDTLSGEIDSGVVQTLASKPVARSAIVLGKWLGYWCMTAGYLVFMVAAILLTLRVLTGFTPPPAVPRTVVLMMLGATVMLTVTIAGGVRLKTVTNGIVAFAFYGIAFIGGWVEQIGAFARSDAMRYVGTAISLVSPADAMWRRAAYELTPGVVRDLQLLPFAAGSVPNAAMIAWAVGFVVVVLFVALRQFQRRAL